MAILKILKYPDPFLRKPTVPVDFEDPNWNELSMGTFLDLGIQHAFDTLYGVDHGAALAANQIGLPTRFFVINKNQSVGDLPRVIVNPKVISKSSETTEEVEGCLSFPGIRVSVRRSREIEMWFQDTCGASETVKVSDWLARVFQHEIDHLDGNLFVDHLNSKRRMEIAKKVMGKR